MNSTLPAFPQPTTARLTQDRSEALPRLRASWTSRTARLSSPQVLPPNPETYYLDPEGYLLDKNKFYLLNHRNELIRLSEKEIALLKKHNIL